MSARMKKKSVWTAAVCLALAGAMFLATAVIRANSVRLVSPTGEDDTDCTATACATITYAISQAVAGDVISVAAGTYNEDVTVNKTLTLQGAGIDASTIVGPMGASGSTIAAAAPGIVIDGFTITREGNNPLDWFSATLNSAGVSVSASGPGLEVRNSRFYGNRNGIDINNVSGTFVHNNIISDNRTGIILRNATDATVVVENVITDNWTLGIVFLDASGGSNVPQQRAYASTFSNNNISGNWYGQVVDRQTGGALPAAGANPKNFQGNWYGTATPVVTTANSAELGYDTSPIPVAYGGAAVPPGGQPDIAGAASANVLIRPLLKSGTDTNLETTPGRGTIGFQGAFTEVVDEDDTSTQPEDAVPTSYWVRYHRPAGVGTSEFRLGPDTPPLGVGSLEFMTTSGTDKEYIFNFDWVGYGIGQIRQLSYSTYRTSGSAAQLPSINIQVNPNTPNNGSFTTLVYEQTYNTPGTVTDGVWQSWDTYNGGAGIWWSTRDLYTAGNVLAVCKPSNGAPACAGKYYVPWSTIVSTIPAAYISGGFGINVGSGGDALTASVDALTLGGDEFAFTYDFDHTEDQTITFDVLANKTFLDPPFQVAASASSGLTVSFSTSGNCTNAGDMVTITGGGSCTVTASQAGNAIYAPAPNVPQAFTINQATASLALSDLTQQYNGSPRSATVTTTPPGLPGVSVTYDGSSTAPSAVGSYAVVASLTNPDYAAPNATGTLVIVDNRTSQVINAPNIANKTTLAANFNLTAYATSQLEITFSSAGPCTLTPVAHVPGSKNWVTTIDVTGAGTCTITMLQAGNATWAPANAMRTFNVTKVSQKITFASLPAKYVNDPPFQVNATANSGLPVQWSAANQCTLSSPTATSVTVTLNGAGSCSITAAQPGDGNYGPATSVTRTFTINQPVVVTSVSIGSSSFTGGCTVLSGRVNLNLVAPSAIPVTVTSDNASVIIQVAPIVVAAGAKSANFTATTTTVALSTAGIVTASTASNGSATVAFTNKPPRLVSIGLSPNVVTSGADSTATVTLDCAAPAGGISVAMTSSNTTRATVPTPLLIPEGASSAQTLVHAAAATATSVNIKASAGGVNKSATLNIVP
jgi:hypothetical protein